MGKKRVLSCSEMVKRFEDAFCENKYVIIMCKYEFGTSMVGSEFLEVYDVGNKITINDMSDTEIIIDKFYIDNISLLKDDFCDEIIVQLGNTKISFLICKS